ncbi:MAG: hypothetical protein EOQ43_01435 [Mesorhizobium sp.]|nr:hypothetical protein [Mesorhizobium sp.]RWB34339.1 MAG: hypothetical protein EOQ43_01435 [Mesorhizobium sp.]
MTRDVFLEFGLSRLKIGYEVLVLLADAAGIDVDNVDFTFPAGPEGDRMSIVVGLAENKYLTLLEHLCVDKKLVHFGVVENVLCRQQENVRCIEIVDTVMRPQQIQVVIWERVTPKLFEPVDILVARSRPEHGLSLDPEKGSMFNGSLGYLFYERKYGLVTGHGTSPH